MKFTTVLEKLAEVALTLTHRTVMLEPLGTVALHATPPGNGAGKVSETTALVGSPMGLEHVMSEEEFPGTPPLSAHELMTMP